MKRIRAHRKLTIGFSIGLAAALAAIAAISLDASSAVNPQPPVTLAAVMDKLETLQSEMQQNARATEAMRAALEQQRGLNTRLINALAAAAPTASSPFAANPSVVPLPRLRMAMEVCAKLGHVAEGKLALKTTAEGDLKGFVGADVFGNGALAKLEVKGGAEAGFEVGPEVGLEATACIDGFAYEIDDATRLSLLAALMPNAGQLAGQLSNAYLNAPKLHTSNLGAPMVALQNVNINASPAQILNGLKQPSSAFQDFQSVAGGLPFPGNVGGVIQNPTSLFPAMQDFDVNNMCTGTQAGTLFDDMCVRARSFTDPLIPISNVVNKLDASFTQLDTKVDNFINNINGVSSNISTLINDVGILQIASSQASSKISNLETGVTGLCNGLNSRITSLRAGVISFPARNFSLNLGPVGTFSIPVDILRTSRPYSGLTNVGCPTF